MPLQPLPGAARWRALCQRGRSPSQLPLMGDRGLFSAAYPQDTHRPDSRNARVSTLSCCATVHKARKTRLRDATAIAASKDVVLPVAARQFFDYFRNLTPAIVPFRQTSWQRLALDANAMLNWRGSSIAPLIAIRAPLSEMSTTVQSRLAKPSSTTRAAKSRFMRRSARFWLLKNIAIGAFEYDPEPSPISAIRSAVLA
jgi:hypothetical protein